MAEGRKSPPRHACGSLRNLRAEHLFLLRVRLFILPFARTVSGETVSGDPIDQENCDYFNDLPVWIPDGSEVRFYSGLPGGERAVIGFSSVNCPTAQTALLSLFKLQKELRDHMGGDIVFLALNVDSERDDLKTIQQYARRFNPGRVGYFVTGRPSHRDVTNRKLGSTLKLPEGHLRQFLIGNLGTGHGVRLVDTAPMPALKDGLRALRNRNGAETLTMKEEQE